MQPQQESNQIIEAQGILDDIFNDEKSPLYDVSHPMHSQVKKAVAALEAEIFRLTLALDSDAIVECYRDIDELLVIGGVIWGNNPADDYFVESHGVKTPDAFWKVIIRGTGQDERVIAWVVPNTQEATRKHLDQYLVNVDDLERMTGEKIPVADYAKHEKPSQSWIIPRGCNKG